MSYISVLILIIISIFCIVSGAKKLHDCKLEKDNEIRSQSIFSGVGLLFFGSVCLILLLSVVFFF